MSKLLLFVSYFVYPSFQGTIFTLLIFEYTVYCKSFGLNWFNFKFEQKWSTYLLSHTSSTFWQLDRMLYSLVTDEEKTIFLNVLIKTTLSTVTSFCHFSFQDQLLYLKQILFTQRGWFLNFSWFLSHSRFFLLNFIFNIVEQSCKNTSCL